MSEIVSTLLPEEQQAQQGNRSGGSAAPTAALLAAADESPYISKPGCPLPFKVRRIGSSITSAVPAAAVAAWSC